MNQTNAQRPQDARALIAIDLGAESCRVSLLRWTASGPHIQLVHRFPNQAVRRDDGLHWDIAGIMDGLLAGLELCAAQAPEGIRSLAVDGWAVDYVRLDHDGRLLGEPFCYRDERTGPAEEMLHRKITAERMRELTGVQILPLNTVYQMFADTPERRSDRWLNLPEYVLHSLGGRAVAERTNATHTQMMALDGSWCEEILKALDVPLKAMPEVVKPGTDLGLLSGPLSVRAAFRDTRLIAPACHDTASAIAAIPDGGDDWAYISSGTWSLVGTLLGTAINTAEAAAENFTNLGGVDGTVCFHKNVNGMWLIRQCMEAWAEEGHTIDVATLIELAAAFGPPDYLLDVDDPDLLLPGDMPKRINAQLRRRGLREFDTAAGDSGQLASFIFHSLAARYAQILGRIAAITGKQFQKLYIMGGGSQNLLLNRLTAEATGLAVIPAGTECSTLGNFACQLAALEGDARTAAYRDMGREASCSFAVEPQSQQRMFGPADRPDTRAFYPGSGRATT